MATQSQTTEVKTAADAKMAADTRTTDMPPAYRPAEVEPRTYERWLAADVFAPDGAGSRADWSQPPFVIIQPPPNITGALHLGHALTATLEDAMVRRARMLGRPTLWLPGLDHASIAAQYVLDRILAAEGESRASLGRERYLERMWQFINATREVMNGQHRRLGASLDWSRLRFTMDEQSSRAVREAFHRLYRAGLAYRTEALINWCPGCRTSVSDLEVIPTPEQGTLWTLRYHLLDEGTGGPDPTAWLAVATTRPETILGDTAVAVHPADERYRGLVGQRVRIPFVERDVPIVADEGVDPAFGTGAVKVTPAHDHADYQIAQRHGLPMVTVLTDDATVNENGEGYARLDRYEARRRILLDLDARGDLEAAREHEMLIGRCQRSNDVIEPRLKTQWFIRTGPMARLALEATRSGRTRIIPPRFEKVWEQWMTNIHDWNVSRQLWWGHRIPAWYCPDGHVTVSALPEGPPACEVCRRAAAELEQDADIFDTWFSSGLWPFSTLGWPDDTDDLRRYYPGSVMETGYDIIFFWVARMMMLGLQLMGDVPFETVYLHGLVKDPQGQRMSKTKGNVVDPLDAIADAGADALRFALLHGTSPGNDQKFRREKLEDARNFGNKLWNAARFVIAARPPDLAAEATLSLPPADQLGPAEHWILERCAATVAAVDRAYAEFQFGEVTRLLYEAVWSEYCDWYLELAKVELGRAGTPGASGSRRAATWSVLAWVLDRYLRLLHPVMPHLTEEIWQRLPHRPGDPDLLIVAGWPTADGRATIDAAAAAGTAALIALVTEARTARAEAGIEPADWLPALIWLPDGPARRAYPDLESAIGRLARIRPRLAERPAELEQATGGLSVIAGDAEAKLVRSDADVERERARLSRELDQARAQLAQTEARLADERFVARA
ncbi:MAG: valine--tRNA ligase, partial [Chloroflexota bacterium]|nr:valine--tRNA ligase [Chloroflexota bacterium]